MKNEPIAKKYFRHVLRSYRLKADLTQNKLSERLGISRGYYSLFELGKRWPNVNMVIRISDALNVRAGEILDSIVAEWRKY